MSKETVPAGTTLAGQYVVGNLLGEGGFGAVYEATQLNLGRRVAIKVLRSDRIFQSSGLERFAREARAAAALGHPHIALVTDFHTNPGEPPFFVMEHLSGRTLGAALAAEGPLPPDRVTGIVQQVLSALEATHAIGIVHRDV
ncbi:MAG: protein kinase, partial [Deltaproteobacteria bacterium]|nr:protein kinase [Deltaproteobacteria bacterium]